MHPSRITLGEVGHVSIGGTGVLVRLANSFGDAPLRISAASYSMAASRR
jgi:hypothetical protein